MTTNFIILDDEYIRADKIVVVRHFAHEYGCGIVVKTEKREFEHRIPLPDDMTDTDKDAYVRHLCAGVVAQIDEILNPQPPEVVRYRPRPM